MKLLGKPLIIHTLIAAKQSRIFDNIVVSSDSKKILDIAKKKSDFVIKRPNQISNGTASKISAIKHALKESENYFEKKFDIIMDLDVTSPLRNISDIINAKKQFIKNKNANLISICESDKNPYFNMIEKIKNKVKIVKGHSRKVFSRQKAPKVFDINASIYIWSRKKLLNAKKVVYSDTGLYLMPRSRSIDIDNLNDYKLVKYYMKNKKI